MVEPLQESTRDRAMSRVNGPVTAVIPAAPLGAMTMGDVMAYEPPPQRDLIAGLLSSGMFCMLTGREKAGKSLLLMDLLLSIALGEPFLGQSTEQGPVILLAAEEHMRDIKARLATRLNGRDPADALFHLIPPHGVMEGEPDFRLEDQVILDRLVSLIKSTGAVAVGLDPLRELHDLPENDSDTMGPLLRPLREIAHVLDVAVVLVHHMGKDGKFRGSTAIRSAVDQEIAFKRSDEGDGEYEEVPTEGKLRIVGRAGPKQVLSVALGQHIRWERSMSLAKIAGTPPPPNLRARIIDCIRAGTEAGLTATEIAARIDSSQKTVQNEISLILRDADPVIKALASDAPNKPRSYVALDPFHLYYGQEPRDDF